MSEIRIESTDATLGATVTGVSLAALEPEEWLQIESAFDEYALLIFPAQQLTHAQQTEFGARFGELAIEGIPISNTRDDGRLCEADDPLMGIHRGNQEWHTDSSYMPVSAKASMLSAHTVPAVGGETQWADMRAAYEALEPAVRARVEGLCAYHSLDQAQKRVGVSSGITTQGLESISPRMGDLKDEDAGYANLKGDPPLRPLVKLHPTTGRPALFIGRHAYGIPDLDPIESQKLLDELVEFACQPPRVYSRSWSVGDIVIWDNRCVLHRVRPWSLDEARVLYHTRVDGNPATESGV